MIVNLHVTDPGNLGDRASAPCDYFCFGRPVQRADVRRAVPHRGGVIIVGGGGLLHPNCRMENLVQTTGAPLVGWGFGVNRHGTSVDRYPDYLGRYALLGMRDSIAPRWVPCVSCMHTAFDRAHRVEHEVVAYEHRKHPMGLGLPTLTNAAPSVDEVVAFLGSAAAVVTSSYYGAYWATLLGRKVVVYRPFASRFHYFRHPPALAGPADWRDQVRTAPSYPIALRECRAANVAFYHDVMSLLDRVTDTVPDFN